MQMLDIKDWAWLIPFRGGFYYDHALLKEYLASLRPWLSFDPADEEAYMYIIRRGLGRGWLRQIPGEYALMQIHPGWAMQLRGAAQRLPQACEELLSTTYITHYQEIAEQLLRQSMSRDKVMQDEARIILAVEWPNLTCALRMSAVRGNDNAVLSTALRQYFQATQQPARWLAEALYLLKQVEGKALDVSGRIDRLDDVVTSLLDLYRPEEARIYVAEAWELSTQLDEGQPETAIRRSALCNSWSRCSTEFAEQQQWLTEAAAISQRAGLERLWARYTYNLSELLLEHGDRADSRDLLEAILPTVRAGQVPELLIQVPLSLASHAQWQGKFAQARRFLREAMRRQSDPQKAAEIRQDLASVYFEEGKIRQAKRQVQEALPVFLKSGNQRQAGNAWNLLSAIAFSENDFADGLEYAQRALGCFANTEQWGLMGQTFGNLAIFCYEQSLWKDGIRYAGMAAEQYDRVGNQLQSARQKLLTSACLLVLGRKKQARMACAEARIIFTQFNDATELKNAEALVKMFG